MKKGCDIFDMPLNGCGLTAEWHHISFSGAVPSADQVFIRTLILKVQVLKV